MERVRPGLWSVPTPFPRSPLRYVLAYLIEAPGGLAIIDTGWPSDEAWDGLVAGVRETGHEISDVAAVLVTHFHADHYGLAPQGPGGLGRLDRHARKGRRARPEQIHLSSRFRGCRRGLAGPQGNAGLEIDGMLLRNGRVAPSRAGPERS